MNYSIKEFRKDFPNDDACLYYIFKMRYGSNITCRKCKKKGSFSKVKKRRCYACAWCGHHVYPTAGTIFHKSPTKLTDWFFAIFLMNNSKKAIAAKDLQRHLGVTYKTAWRMIKQINKGEY